MNDEWRQCEPSRRIRRLRRRLEPRGMYVSINRRGDIAMNAAAYSRLGEVYNVALFYDAARRRIGVKYPVYGDGRMFPVRRYGRGKRMRVVRAGRFMAKFEVVIERSLRFPQVTVETYKTKPMLVLDLETAVPVRARPSAVRQSSVVGRRSSVDRGWKSGDC